MLIKNILISISFTVCGYGRLGSAIRCESNNLPIDDVRQVISACTKKFITNDVTESSRYPHDDHQQSHNAAGNHRSRQQQQQQHNQYNNIRQQQHENLQPSYGNSYNASTMAQDEAAKACILQCFFEEFKMVNHEGFPDKRKMAQVLTREVDWELRNFYLDSIDQCFRMMEYQVTTYVDKCFFAKRIIDCLAEIASLNCSDWDGERVMV